jgi:hypothetical protein
LRRPSPRAGLIHERGCKKWCVQPLCVGWGGREEGREEIGPVSGEGIILEGDGMWFMR